MIIENYHIGKKVSEDFIGEIYLANTTDLEHAVYFKFLHEHFREDSELIDSFHRCAESASSFNSDYQINTLSHGNDDGRDYVILENFNLIPLQTLLRQKKIFALHETVSFIEKLALILRKIHLEDRAYGILIPQNVFVSENLQSAKIANVGFSDFVRKALKSQPSVLRDIAPYLAPEMFQDTIGVDRQSDIYSVGALFYRLLLGESPHKADAKENFVPPDKPSLIPPSLQRLEIPDFLDSIVLDALDPIKENRCPNLSQFLKQLGEAKATLLASFTPTTEIVNAAKNNLQNDESQQESFVAAENEIEAAAIDEQEDSEENAKTEAEIYGEEEPEDEAPTSEITELRDDEVGPDEKTAEFEGRHQGDEDRPGVEEEADDDLPGPFDEMDEAQDEFRNGINQPAEESGDVEYDEEVVNKGEPELQDFLTEESTGDESSPQPEERISAGLDEPRQITSIEEYEFDDKGIIYFTDRNEQGENGTSRPATEPAEQETADGTPVGSPPTAPELIPKPQPEFSADEQDFFNDTETQTSTLVTTMNINQANPGGRSALGVMKIVAMILLPLVVISFLVAVTFDVDLSTKVRDLFSTGSNGAAENPVTGEERFFQERTSDDALDTPSSQSRKQETLSAGPQHDQVPRNLTEQDGQTQPPSEPMDEDDPLTNLLSQKEQENSRPQQAQRPATAPVKPRLDIYVTDGISPLRAEVFVNGRSVGQSDVRGRLFIPDLQRGASYIIKIQKEGYRLWAKEVKLGSADRQRLTVELHQLLPGAENDNTSGNSTDEARRQVQSANGNNGVSESAPATRGSPAVSSPDRTNAVINIALSNPEPLSDVFIYVNGTLWNGEDNLAPGQLSLPPGDYTIEVRKEGYRSAPPSFTIDVVGGETQTLSFILLPN